MLINEDLLWNKALGLMPKGTQTLSKCPDQFVDGVYPKFAHRAEGAYIEALNGEKYLDFMCGLGPIILGFNDKDVNQAIVEQLKRGTIFSLPTTLEIELAELIVETVPSAEMVRFAKNGTDVCTAAVRIARSYTGREHIIKCGYHGWSDWHGITMQPFGMPKCLKEYVHEFEYNNLHSLEKLLQKHEAAAIIMEAEALTAPEPGFLEGVRELATKYGALLIFDEVVTGYRWSIGGAQKHYGVTPDLTCLGKAIANGLPISVITGKKEYMTELNDVFFSMTFGGECLSIAAAIATIKKLKTKDYKYLWDLNKIFCEGIESAAKRHKLKINLLGSSLRHNFYFDECYEDSNGMKDLFYQEMVKRGILFSKQLYIQFSHTKEDMLKVVKAADESFEIVAKHKDNIDDILEGKRSKEVFLKIRVE